MSTIWVYIAFDGDHIGRKIGRASLANDPDEVRRISQAIEAGNEIWRSWALGHGADVINIGGDEGRVRVGAEHLGELPDIKRRYAERVGSTVSVGVGSKLGDADKALLAAKLEGGDRIRLYTQEVEELLAKQPEKTEEEKIRDEYLDKGEEDTSFDFGANVENPSAGPTDPHGEAKKSISRMRHPNKAMAEAFLHYASGGTTVRPVVTPEIEKHLARFGVVDPDGYPYDAFGRDMRRGLPKNGRKGKGPVQKQPDALLRHRMMLQGRDPGYIKNELAKEEPALNTPNAGGGMTGAHEAQTAAPDAPIAEGSEHNEVDATQQVIDNAPPLPEGTHAAQDLHQELSGMADQQAAQDEESSQQQAQAEGDQKAGGDLKAQIVSILKEFKERAPELEAIQKQDPELYKALVGMVQSMIQMAQQLYGGQPEGEPMGEDKKEAPVEKSELEKGDVVAFPGKKQSMKVRVDPEPPEHAGKIDCPQCAAPCEDCAESKSGTCDAPGHSNPADCPTCKGKGKVSPVRVAKEELEKGDLLRFPGNPAPAVDQGALATVPGVIKNPAQEAARAKYQDALSAGAAATDAATEGSKFKFGDRVKHVDPNYEASYGTIARTRARDDGAQGPGLYHEVDWRDPANNYVFTDFLHENQLTPHLTIQKSDLEKGDVVNLNPPPPSAKKYRQTKNSPPPAKTIGKIDAGGARLVDPVTRGTRPLARDNHGSKVVQNFAPQFVPDEIVHGKGPMLRSHLHLIDHYMDQFNKTNWDKISPEEHELHSEHLGHIQARLKESIAANKAKATQQTMQQKGFSVIKEEAKPGCKHFYGKGGKKCLRCKEPKVSDNMDKGALEAGKTGHHDLQLPVGTQKDGSANGTREMGKIKVQHPEDGKTSWVSVRAGQVMSQDGHPISSRNPGGK